MAPLVDATIAVSCSFCHGLFLYRFHSEVHRTVLQTGSILRVFRVISVPDVIPESPAEPMPVTILAPSDSQSMAFDRFGDWLSKETFASIYSGKTEMRFDARVRYTDIFEVEHEMECGGIFMHKSKTFRIDYNDAN